MFLALLAIAAAIVFASTRVNGMATAIEDLTNEVHQATTVAAGAVALIEGLAQKLHDNADDPDAIEALANELQQSTAALSGAVTANTAAQGTAAPAAASSEAAAPSETTDSDAQTSAAATSDTPPDQSPTA